MEIKDVYKKIDFSKLSVSEKEIRYNNIQNQFFEKDYISKLINITQKTETYIVNEIKNWLFEQKNSENLGEPVYSLKKHFENYLKWKNEKSEKKYETYNKAAK